MARHIFSPAHLLGPLVLSFALAAPASAEDVAAAEALFNRGVADMKASKFETACPAIEESYRLDPRPGTLFTLAECEAKRGRVATAVTRYGDYLALFSRLPPDQQVQQKGRDKIASQKKAALMPSVPQITLTLPPDAPRGTVVKRDDAVLSEAALGVALPIDPGEHVVTTQAPGGDVTETKVTIQKAEKKQLVLTVKTAPETASTAASTSTSTSTPSASAAPTSPPPPVAGSSGRRTAAFVVGGVGVAGLAVGGVMGGLALSKKAVVKDNCMGVYCNHEGKVAADAGKRFALVSTVGFGVGLAGVVTAVVLFATAPSAPRPAAKAPAQKLTGDVWSTDQGGTVLGVRGAW